MCHSPRLLLPFSEGGRAHLLSTLHVLLEPLHSLQKCTLLGVSLHAITQIPSYRESMLHTTVQVNLVRQARILEDSFRLVTFLGGEDLIGLGGGDGEWTFHVFELGSIDEGGVRGVPDVDFAGVRAKVPHDVFAAEAVAYATDFLGKKIVLVPACGFLERMRLLVVSLANFLISSCFLSYFAVVFRPHLDQA